MSDIGEVRVFAAMDADRPERGEIWWTSASCDGPGGYEGLDRMPFVILDESRHADRTWVGAAPVWPDVDLANELDLVLDESDTTLGLPTRVQLRRRITLAWEQLEEKLGEVQARGEEMIDAALRGEGDLEWFGTPYESEHDWRIAADRWAAELVAELQGPYFATLREVEEASDEGGLAVEGIDMRDFLAATAKLTRLAPADHEFALAARDKRQKPVIEIAVERPELRAYLWANTIRGVLELHIERVAGEWWNAVELLVGVNRGDTISSPAFVPKPNLTVTFGENEGVRLDMIETGTVRFRLKER